MILLLANRPEEISRAQQALAHFAEANGLSGKPVSQLALAVEEFLANIVKYAWADPAPHFVEMEILMADGEILLTLSDDGSPFNPLSRPAPDTTLPLAEKPVGGLGIFMARNFLDEVRYERREGRNVLTLRKGIGD